MYCLLGSMRRWAGSEAGPHGDGLSRGGECRAQGLVYAEEGR